MNVQHIIRELRGILNTPDLAQQLQQQQYDAIVAAIRALGGNP